MVFSWASHHNNPNIYIVRFFLDIVVTLSYLKDSNLLRVLLMKALVLPLVQEWTIFVASVSCASALSRAGDQTTLDTASRRPHVGSKFSFTDHSNSWTRFYRPCQSMSHDLAASFWANLLTFGHGLMSLEAGHSI